MFIMFIDLEALADECKADICSSTHECFLDTNRKGQCVNLCFVINDDTATTNSVCDLGTQMCLLEESADSFDPKCV